MKPPFASNVGVLGACVDSALYAWKLIPGGGIVRLPVFSQAGGPAASEIVLERTQNPSRGEYFDGLCSM